MTNTRSSRRISSAIASRKASRKVTDCIAAPLVAAGAAFGATGANATTTSGAGVGATAGAGEVLVGTAASSSLEISAITVPTFTPSVPSGTEMEVITPSSTASNSIVALSVSISARISPDLTLSPSLTNHLASVPSSIVGESAGIFSSIAINIAPPTRQYIVRTNPVQAMLPQNQQIRSRFFGFPSQWPSTRRRSRQGRPDTPCIPQ